ncbi:Hypothetical_protein [Hexamita inflata]|uniref:Hypothetical_protein n=1 Tax=Hexamita inflata TaxID=28002 RepID=A0AA86Q0P7_9EUKA|nr:Hypothetical protein HINF_LOCUS35003 [Hexamita inflata]
MYKININLATMRQCNCVDIFQRIHTNCESLEKLHNAAQMFYRNKQKINQICISDYCISTAVTLKIFLHSFHYQQSQYSALKFTQHDWKQQFGIGKQICQEVCQYKYDEQTQQVGHLLTQVYFIGAESMFVLQLQLIILLDATVQVNYLVLQQWFQF